MDGTGVGVSDGFGVGLDDGRGVGLVDGVDEDGFDVGSGDGFVDGPADVGTYVGAAVVGAYVGGRDGVAISPLVVSTTTHLAFVPVSFLASHVIIGKSPTLATPSKAMIHE